MKFKYLLQVHYENKINVKHANIYCEHFYISNIFNLFSFEHVLSVGVNIVEPFKLNKSLVNAVSDWSHGDLLT